MAMSLDDLEINDIILIDGTPLICRKASDEDHDIALQNPFYRPIVVLDKSIHERDWHFFSINRIRAEAKSIRFVGSADTFFRMISTNSGKFPELQ